MTSRLTAAAVALLALAGCTSNNVTPAPEPVPVVVPPVVAGPAIPSSIRSACTVAEWALPVVLAFKTVPANVQQAVADIQGALPACAAGNSSEVIVDAVNAVLNFLHRKGRHPPQSMPRYIVRK